LENPPFLAENAKFIKDLWSAEWPRRLAKRPDFNRFAQKNERRSIRRGAREFDRCRQSPEQSSSSVGGPRGHLRAAAGSREYAHFIMVPEVLELFVTSLRLAGLPEK